MGCRSSQVARYPHDSLAASCRGCAPPPGAEISAKEVAAFVARQVICETAINEFCTKHKISPRKQPVIAIALSGGGWRAYASSAAFLDGLSEAGILDTATYMAGVSGGGWCMFNYALGGQYNPIHATNDNPWIAGGRFCSNDPRYQYAGLVKMVNREHIAAASCHDVDSTGKSLLPSIINCEKLGVSSVERWANFLANDLLYWTDVVKPGSSRTLDISDDEVTKYILDGSKPIPIFSAIANGAKRHRRKYDWVEFTPFGARRYGPKVLPEEGVLPLDQLQGDYEAHVKGDPTLLDPTVPNEGYRRLYAHHLMAICGSAFATDWAAAVRALSLPLRIITKPIAAFKCNELRPVLGTGTTNIAGLGKLRDGGISINVPYPALLPMSSCREIDIVVVMDATEGCEGALSIKDAVKQGYYKIDPKDVAEGSEWLSFCEKRRVHVFHPREGSFGPVIVFFLGMTNRDTLDIVWTQEQLLADCARIRNWVASEVVPAFAQALADLPEYTPECERPSSPLFTRQKSMANLKARREAGKKKAKGKVRQGKTFIRPIVVGPSTFDQPTASSLARRATAESPPAASATGTTQQHPRRPRVTFMDQVAVSPGNSPAATPEPQTQGEGAAAGVPRSPQHRVSYVDNRGSPVERPVPTISPTRSPPHASLGVLERQVSPPDRPLQTTPSHRGASRRTSITSEKRFSLDDDSVGRVAPRSPRRFSMTVSEGCIEAIKGSPVERSPTSPLRDSTTENRRACGSPTRAAPFRSPQRRMSLTLPGGADAAAAVQLSRSAGHSRIPPFMFRRFVSPPPCADNSNRTATPTPPAAVAAPPPNEGRQDVGEFADAPRCDGNAPKPPTRCPSPAPPAPMQSPRRASVGNDIMHQLAILAMQSSQRGARRASVGDEGDVMAVLSRKAACPEMRLTEILESRPTPRKTSQPWNRLAASRAVSQAGSPCASVRSRVSAATTTAAGPAKKRNTSAAFCVKGSRSGWVPAKRRDSDATWRTFACDRQGILMTDFVSEL